MSEKLEKFRNTYSYKELIKKHSLDTVGVWEIRGEDSNPDWAGTHVEPYLTTVQGKLSNVIEKAVELPGFWQWGGGGSIRSVHVENVTDLTNRIELAAEKKRLEDRIKEINALL